MSDAAPRKIYAPSIHWFSYQLYEGLSDNPEALKDITPQWVEKRYQAIFGAFGLSASVSIRTDRPSSKFHLINSDEILDFTVDELGLEGFIYPQSIHDSYALHLNIYQPEKIGCDAYEISDLEQFNPQNCLTPQPSSNYGYLGQTLLISAYLDSSPPDNIRDLEDCANQCLVSFFNLKNSAQYPKLYRVSNFLGGYLYEYGNPEITLENNSCGHVLIWFLFAENPTLILQKCYFDLPELFLYYHKSVNHYQQSRIFYQKADELSSKTEQGLKEFQDQYITTNLTESTLADTELDDLKTLIKTLLKDSLAYSKELRNLEYARNTIAINTSNYQYTLEQMAQSSQNPLTTLQFFRDRESPKFQQQIAADLIYLRQGYNLLDKAIATIRGLVEIDQAQRDRKRLEAEKERDRQAQENREKQERLEKERDRARLEAEENLQDSLQAVGVGIAAGAIVASTSGLITQPWEFPNRDRILLPPHPFLIALVGSVLCSVGGWWVATKIIEKRRSRSD
ncbi:MAG: hypothetical protein ACLFV6_15805 [Spirulinaceae cyanobacterium]